MLTPIIAIVLAAAPAVAPAATPVAPSRPSVAAPPSPKAAARAATANQLPKLPASRIDPRRVPSTYDLSRDPGFTPWSSFLSLGHDGVGAWTLEGTSIGSGLRCVDSRQGGCQPLGHAMIAVVWQPDGTRLGFFAGPSVTAMPLGGGMQSQLGFTAGIRIKPASLVSVVRRLRRGE